MTYILRAADPRSLREGYLVVPGPRSRRFMKHSKYAVRYHGISLTNITISIFPPTLSKHLRPESPVTRRATRILMCPVYTAIRIYGVFGSAIRQCYLLLTRSFQQLICLVSLFESVRRYYRSSRPSGNRCTSVRPGLQRLMRNCRGIEPTLRRKHVDRGQQHVYLQQYLQLTGSPRVRPQRDRDRCFRL